MTRVVLAPAYGGPEVLTVVDEPVREPGPGQARIAVRAAGVNPADWKSYGGAFGADPAKLPRRVGSEAAGVVTAVGPDAEGPAGPLSVGDEVIGHRLPGAYAEEVVGRASAFVPKPPTLPWEQAGGLLLTGVTAVHALTAAAVGAGDTVLVHGAAGGVGLMAVQLAAARGARVIGTVGGGSADLVRRLGAEPVRYGAGLAGRVRELAPEGVDAAVDTVGTDEAVDVSIELVADRGRIATIAAFGRGPAEGLRLLGNGPGADPGTAVRDQARLELTRLAGEGRLEVVVAGTFPLEQVAEAHRQGMAGHTHGKLVLLP
jgi:NADPH:quinone reductase